MSTYIIDANTIIERTPVAFCIEFLKESQANR